MKRPMSEETITDGMRHIGRVVPKGPAFECFDAEGRYLCKCETIREARAAVMKAAREGAAA